MIFTQLNLSSKVILALFVTALMLLILYYSFKMIELAYVMKKQKPFFVHFYLFKTSKGILEFIVICLVKLR